MGKKIIIIAALAIIISLVVFNYYPRSLERVAGTEGITANDISQIKISLYVYKENPGRAPETEKITNNEIITDKAFISDVLALFEDQTMRRRLLAPKVEYRSVIFEKPSYTVLAISFEDTREQVLMDISNDSRFITVWSSQSERTKYRLYGEGIDTPSLLESLLKLDVGEGN